MNMMEDKWNAMQSSRQLGMDDTFEFDCSACGECCYGHDDIILTGFDVFRLAQKLKMATAEVLERYCDMHVGAETKMPVPTMAKTKKGACPLLAYGRCTVHDHKPVTCALYPLGRCVEYGEKKITYFVQGEGIRDRCHSTPKVHTLREWLSEYNLLDQDEDIFAWIDATVKVVESAGFKWYKDNYDKLPSAVKDVFWQAATVALFGAFDMNRPFAEQITKNVEQLCRVMDGMLFKIKED